MFAESVWINFMELKIFIEIKKSITLFLSVLYAKELIMDA